MYQLSSVCRTSRCVPDEHQLTCFCGAGYTDTAANSEPVVDRTALAVLSANIQLALVPVQHQE
eukprot:1606268-Rhodomonas_salina.1